MELSADHLQEALSPGMVFLPCLLLQLALSAAQVQSTFELQPVLFSAILDLLGKLPVRHEQNSTKA